MKIHKSFDKNCRFTILTFFGMMNRALGNGVGFARVGLEQLRVFTDSDITTEEENDELNLSNEDLNRTIIRPSRGISKSFSSLFNLPKINTATENMSTEDWIVDDDLQKCCDKIKIFRLRVLLEKIF